MGIKQRRQIAAFIFLAALILPAHATAAVLINEIAWMGTTVSSNAEWIELVNTGSSSVPLTGWTLLASNGSPNITLAGTIAADGFFLLERTNDSSVPGITADQIYSGALVNSGATLTLSDLSGAIIDQVVGGSNWQNVGGDNVSKQTASRTATGWATENPTPRAANQNGVVFDTAPDSDDSGNTGASDADADDATTSTQSVTQTSGSTPAPAMTVDAGGDRTVEAGAGAFFTGHLYNADGIPIQHARYLWNFGDGETREGQTVFYAYPYAGTYVVTLAVDAGDEYSADGRAIIQAVPPEVSLSSGSDGSLTIGNTTHSKSDLDLSLWMLRCASSTFTIPKGTIVLPGKAVRFAPNVLNIGTSSTAQLLYPNGFIAATTDPAAGDPHTPGIEYLDAADPAPPVATIPGRTPRAAAASAVPSAELVNSDAGLPSAAATFSVAQAAAASSALPAAVAATPADVSPFWLSLIGLASLLVLAVSGLLYARSAYDPTSKPKAEAHEDEADALAAEFAITVGAE